jgi:phosphatidylglycerol lysyltransferase
LTQVSERPAIARESGEAPGTVAEGAGSPFREPRLQRLLISLAIALAVAALIAAFSDEVRDLDYSQTVRSLRHMPDSTLVLSLLATVFSFAALIGREATALAFLGARLPAAAVIIGGISGAALGNAAGFGVLTAAAVRYRIYGAVGVKAFDVARLVGFLVAGFTVGLAAVGGFCALWQGADVAAALGLPTLLVRTAGALGLGLSLSLIVFGAPRSLRLAGFPATGPSRLVMTAQVLFSMARLAGAATALWVLLPPLPLGFSAFLTLFAAATALGALSHIPAGAGVFELVVFWALRGRASGEAVAAALITYRAIYYALPLLISAAAFAYFEARLAFASRPPATEERLARAAARLSPTFMSVIAFAMGIMLIVSGVTPTFGKRLSLLSELVPLWTVELSSFLGSVLGVALLFVARGLIGRRNGAWRLAIAIAASSLVFSLLKGLAFGEAAFLMVFAALLLASRRQFDRPTAMFDQPFTWGWYFAVGGLLWAASGILWLAFHNQPSAPHGVWWQFEFDAQKPRALRALLGASLLTVTIGLRQLLKAPPGRAPAPRPQDLARVAEIVENHPRGDALMAFMGDKSLMFSKNGRAFLMYGKRGRSWIALYDPVGARDEWRELIERFGRLCYEHGGRACFYQVRPENLPLYLDAGFTAVKLGEEAVIGLAGFTMRGGAFSNLRYALKRGERDGLDISWLEPEEAMARFDDLAEISGNWLEARRGEEKGFSVAAFDAAFLTGQRVALLTERGHPVAFCSIMATERGDEATLALMRSSGAASPAAMEFLMTRLVLKLRDLGFQRFSLGAAPLAGVRSRPLSSRWHRLASLIWKHGDRFYNFQGLRTFKNKFQPIWEPRYFVSSGAPFVALADAAALIASGPARAQGAAND